MIDTPLSSETYPDEKLIPIQYARTNSEYHIRDIFGHETAYPATNVRIILHSYIIIKLCYLLIKLPF